MDKKRRGKKVLLKATETDSTDQDLTFVRRLRWVFIAVLVYLVYLNCSIPKFSELGVRSGILISAGPEAGSNKHRYFPVTINSYGNYGKIEDIHLPPAFKSSDFEQNIGKNIDIYSDSLKVWHVAGNNVVYYDYDNQVSAYKSVMPIDIIIKLIIPLGFWFSFESSLRARYRIIVFNYNDKDGSAES